jgi:enoyl-CoA hydratase/carnithine racemase
MSELTDKWGDLVDRPRFDDYAKKFADYFAMRRIDGVVELRMHTKDGPFVSTMGGHNALGQAWQEIGNDPDNHVIILTGTGDQWMTADLGAHFDEPANERPPVETAEAFSDARRLLEQLIFSIDVPTIAAVNGPGLHTEFALACDLTICTEDTAFLDGHFAAAMAPGDGQGLTFQETIGTKRAAYHLYTGLPIDASSALAWGLVNEVVSSDRLLQRAWELAESIMSAPINARRMTHAIVSRPWKRRVVDDFGFHLSHELCGIVGDRLGSPPLDVVSDTHTQDDDER